jgi:5-methylcytosine-specific restriction protein A
MLYDILLRIGNEYESASLQPLGQHPLGDYVRRECSNLAARLGGVAKFFSSKGSVGQGNWAAVPWIAFFDPIVTDKATQGYYVVYLFNVAARKVYLSLNQGTTAVVEEFKKTGGLSVLRKRAELIRCRINDGTPLFPIKEIFLDCQKTLPQGYEAGHSVGFCYDLDQLPQEEQLRQDLALILTWYKKLTYRGGLKPTPEDQVNNRVSLERARQYKLHRAFEQKGRALSKSAQAVRCGICGFSFAEVYGELGDGFSEVHHLKPIDTLDDSVAVNGDEEESYVSLCANCHRMIHLLDDSSDIDMLRNVVFAQRVKGK